MRRRVPLKASVRCAVIAQEIPAMSTLARAPSDLAAILDLLAGVELFDGLDGTELRALGAHLLLREFGAGDAVFREGDPGDWMGILVSGEIHVRKEADTRDTRVVAIESRRRAIGEMALVDGEPRSATCIAAMASSLLVLSRESFRRLGRERPALALEEMHRIARLISRRLRTTSGRLVEHLAA
jgi:CRP-like cAMP-binding protein